VVARDGIEPPTPAFSGLGPLSVIFLILFILLPVFALKIAFYWNEIGMSFGMDFS
jgi:hypothetical protein